MKNSDNADPYQQIEQIKQLKKQANTFREKSIEFQGLEREFTFIQDEIIKEYERSSVHRKHPADMGAIREEILRKFLSSQCYLPSKYGISKSSIRIVSTTGHTSGQIDLAIYDALNTPKLLTYKDVSFLPIETVYGVIQVKSNLSSTEEVNKGLENLASFKKLNATDNRFGILFAYDCSLKWKTLVATVKNWILKNPSVLWPNFVVVLKQGLLAPAQENERFRISDFENLSQPTIRGIPDHNDTLLKFYLYLMDLLKLAKIEEPDLYKYVRLPFTENEKAYHFTYGAVGEIGKCPEHGEYLRQISYENLKKIIDICFSSQPIDMFQLFEADQGSNNLPSPIKNQSQAVYLYNFDNLPLSDILTLPRSTGLCVDLITIEDKICVIPQYYSFRDKLISVCPKCNYPANMFFPE